MRTSESPTQLNVQGMLFPTTSASTTISRSFSVAEVAPTEEKPPILGVGKYKTSTGLVCGYRCC
jgi:hypothetical protein